MSESGYISTAGKAIGDTLDISSISPGVGLYVLRSFSDKSFEGMQFIYEGRGLSDMYGIVFLDENNKILYFDSAENGIRLFPVAPSGTKKILFQSLYSYATRKNNLFNIIFFNGFNGSIHY